MLLSRFACLHRGDREGSLYAPDMALVGINHVALEVGSIDEALAFWERLFGPL